MLLVLTSPPLPHQRVCVHVYVCVCMCMFVCVCVWVYFPFWNTFLCTQADTVNPPQSLQLSPTALTKQRVTFQKVGIMYCDRWISRLDTNRVNRINQYILNYTALKHSKCFFQDVFKEKIFATTALPLVKVISCNQWHWYTLSSS